MTTITLPAWVPEGLEREILKSIPPGFDRMMAADERLTIRTLDRLYRHAEMCGRAVALGVPREVCDPPFELIQALVWLAKGRADIARELLWLHDQPPQTFTMTERDRNPTVRIDWDPVY